MSRGLQRLAAMSAAELRFRLGCGMRTALERCRGAVAPPQWPRADREAHLALAARLAAGTAAFPPAGPDLAARVACIKDRFPSAPKEARDRADRILNGRYDLLGYRDLQPGIPPDWHADPVHGRGAPMAFWADVPFLDPAIGDHKVIWELNRHQHWLALARAFQLTGDRRYYVEFVAQLESWLAANPPLLGINWASMLELAFRALSWIWSLHLFAPAVAADPPGAPPWTIELVSALDRQLTHVERNLSRYFSPNTHLTGEALALYVSGLALPQLRASRRRVALGRAILLDETRRQIRPDGGHAELSTHYHRYSTDYYLLAFAAARAAHDAAAARFEETAVRLAEFLRTLADDRGRVPLIGDDDGGALFPICGREPSDCRDTLATAAVLLSAPGLAVGDAPEEAFWMCGAAAAALSDRAARWQSRALPDSGYFVSRTGTGDHLVFDAGPHGFLNGGHAHADALAVALTIRNEPLLVDSGTATYTMDAALRDRFRSTPMHNTVTIARRSQSVPNGPFHWRSRADASASMWQCTERYDFFEGRHRGYAPVTHVRQVLAVPAIGWFVIDHVLGDGSIDADLYWHLHPRWRLRQEHRSGTWLAESNGLLAAIGSDAVLMPVHDDATATYAPVYGRIVSAPCLTARFPPRAPCSRLSVVTAEPALALELTVERVVVAQPPARGWHGSAFRLHSAHCECLVFAAVELDGVPAHPGASPGAFWGGSGAITDARVALAVLNCPEPLEPLVVNGTAVQVSAAGAERTGLGRASGSDPNFSVESGAVNASCVE